jgi:2-dehydro-3-deoxyphosphooctonate aldolase (KDO 8-P synthase)
VPSIQSRAFPKLLGDKHSGPALSISIMVDITPFHPKNSIFSLAFTLPGTPPLSRRKISLVNNSFEIGPVRVGDGKLFLIAGPCVIESEAHVRRMAEAIQRVTADLGMPYIFKASFDKANRTSVKSFRGPGLVEGTGILGRLAKDTGLPVLTDVHEPGQCQIAAEAVDVLQIPAFLCRQTDLLVAAGKTGRAVNVKKGQFVAPWDMTHPVEKVRSTGNERVFLTERGASFGYNTLVVDYRSLPVMRRMAPVVFDGTHSVQQPSSAGLVSGGQPEFIPLLARAAVAAGVDGLFLEVHDDPAHAQSDGANALDLKLLKPLLERLLAIHAAAGN